MGIATKFGDAEFYKEFSINKAPIVIFGAGAWGQKVAKNLKKSGYSVDYFCDNSKEKIGKLYSGIKCIAPIELARQNFIHIIVAVNFGFVLTIMNQLGDLDIRGNVYLHFSGDDLDEREKIREQDSLLMPYFSEGKVILKDCCSKNVNVQNNIRVTPARPQHAENQIVILGDSRCVGLKVQDSETIAGYLQRKINAGSCSYEVINQAAVADNIYSARKKFLEYEVKRGDLVIISPPSFLTSKSATGTYLFHEIDEIMANYLVEMKERCVAREAYFCVLILGTAESMHMPSEVETTFRKSLVRDEKSYNANHLMNFSDYLKILLLANNVNVLDLRGAMQRPHKYGEIFEDCDHYNANGNLLIASEIMKMVQAVNDKLIINKRALQKKRTIENDLNELYEKSRPIELNIWLNEVQKRLSICDIDGEIGSIVMNANPFTRGHRFLVEEALKNCDFLIIFVLKEDKSYFRYADRINMVRMGTADLNKVRVVDGGSFIISSETFPQYFEKENFQDSIDASKDLELFSNFVAPTLKIVKRFVGTEPYCSVTNAYNKQMESILEKGGIKVILINRMNFNDKAISATDVRRLIEKKEFETIKDLVVPTTLEYLMKLNEER